MEIEYIDQGHMYEDNGEGFDEDVLSEGYL